MKSDIQQLMYRVSTIMEGEDIPLLFELIRKDISQKILLSKPEESKTREELYYMSYGVTLLERKMTELSNDVIKENE